MHEKILSELRFAAKDLSILCLIDNEAMRQDLQDFFQDYFAQVFCVALRELSWQECNNGSIDVIIMEYTDTLPKSVIRAVREHDIRIPFFLYKEKQMQHTYAINEYKIDGCFSKPFDKEAFTVLLLKALCRVEMEKKISLYDNQCKILLEKERIAFEQKYLYDPLTKLGNTGMLRRDIEGIEFGYIMLLDISNFLAFNKEYGKEFADNILYGVARMLEQHIMNYAKLYKIESDRYVIVLESANKESVSLYCDQIISFFDHKHVEIEDVSLHISFNIGVDIIREDLSESLINCEYALEKAKEYGSRHYKIFDKNMIHIIDKKGSLKWLNMTRELIIEDSIEPYYQPIMDLNSGAVLKYEVLARGVENGTVLPPDQFLHAAEQLGFLTIITRTMVRKSFEYMRDKNIYFSINLTELDLIDPKFIRFLERELQRNTIDASRVTFEILENVAVTKNSIIMTQKMQALKNMGFKIAIDDFGIENANMSRFMEMKFDFLKIDGMFVKDITTMKNSVSIVKAIVKLAKTLNIQTIAEYVKDKATFELIKECGVDMAQGYYVGKPLPEVLQE